ncbi:OLC1v1005971C1 [Oldenlandia corymbosa var. corymbosa]|uniref:OLC1v1005971C1 n=1 Tax=Oldenlandia corymbosa var. corymbosa TaxID=529605 RepID=A0AAV1DJA0_OLDCO|nr:OLC1v1005971C1 [Oldenlandia corymbosa var. corymbosa]
MASFTSSPALITGFFFLFLAFTSIFGQSSVPAVYVFGDSLVDVGNNNYIEGSILKANYPYNGVDYPGRKSTGRFCNGKNTADLFAEKVGLMASPPPYLSNTSDLYLKGVSFASGGSGLFNTTGEGFLRKTLSLSEEVTQYTTLQSRLAQHLGVQSTQQHLSKSLFLVVTGSNDVFAYFQNENIRKVKSPDQYINEMIAILQDLMMQLQSLGARKFVVPGLTTLGCTPARRFESNNEECNAAVNAMATKYNQNLTKMLATLQSNFKDNIYYTYIDTYTVLSGIIQNPATYGFKEAKAACCGLGKLNAALPCTPLSIFCPNRTDHVFWDRVHPTQATASILVNTLYSGSPPDVSPLNVQQLIAL